jgi:hypothetical protein
VPDFLFFGDERTVDLSAAYNPETATTARKQTGSFYTPREIVDYMVDAALIAYLERALTTKHTKDTKNERQPQENPENTN